MKKEESSASCLTVMAIGFCPRNGQVIAFRGRKAASNMRSRGTHGYAVCVVVKVRGAVVLLAARVGSHS